MNEELAPSPPRKKKVLIGILLGVVILVAAAGVALLVAIAVAPDFVNEKVGNTMTAVEKQAAEITGQIPSVTLGAPGGDAELDRCDGTFTELVNYRSDTLQIPPVYGAHNSCQGKTILILDVGSLIDVADQAGIVKRYQVVELKDVPPETSTTADIDGISGELVLQTCNWSWDVRFAALAPIAM